MFKSFLEEDMKDRMLMVEGLVSGLLLRTGSWLEAWLWNRHRAERIP